MANESATGWMNHLKEVRGSVAVLISGGVDSAVVVHLLCEAGLKPDLHYIKIGMDGEDSSCTAEEDIELSQAKTSQGVLVATYNKNVNFVNCKFRGIINY